jgi:hypothetical protein
MRPRARLRRDEPTNDRTAVARIAAGVGRFGWIFGKTASRTNMCRRYVP